MAGGRSARRAARTSGEMGAGAVASTAAVYPDEPAKDYGPRRLLCRVRHPHTPIPELSVVMPAYNEEAVLPHSLAEAAAALGRLCDRC